MVRGSHSASAIRRRYAYWLPLGNNSVQTGTEQRPFLRFGLFILSWWKNVSRRKDGWKNEVKGAKKCGENLDNGHFFPSQTHRQQSKTGKDKPFHLLEWSKNTAFVQKLVEISQQIVFAFFSRPILIEGETKEWIQKFIFSLSERMKNVDV